MGSASWNDAEDEALRKLPWRARVAYLQGIRRHMDFRTGWAGRTRVLSYQFFSELLEASEKSTKPDPAMNKDGLRAIFTMLERVGLVEWPRGTAHQRGVVFRCLLADWDDSVQKQDAPKTHPRRTQTDAPSETRNSNGSGDIDAPKTHPSRTKQDAPPPVFRYPEREEGANAPLSVAPRRGDDQDVLDVLQRLNDLARTGFKAKAAGRETDAAKLVRARLLEHGKDALLRVVERKVAEWGQDAKMVQFLRPATLFGRQKCEQYVGQLSVPARVDPKRAQADELEAWVNGGGSATIIEGVFSRER